MKTKTEKPEYKRIGWMMISDEGHVADDTFTETKAECIRQFEGWRRVYGGRCESVYIKVKK